VGEFALGVNPHIERPMGDILYDEKISGSLHFTPGAAYEDICDNGNRSAVHWDLVLIQTSEWGGGEIWFDGVLVRKDGRFVLPELERLNAEQGRVDATRKLAWALVAVAPGKWTVGAYGGGSVPPRSRQSVGALPAQSAQSRRDSACTVERRRSSSAASSMSVARSRSVIRANSMSMDQRTPRRRISRSTRTRRGS
jgi:hypothetical protein